MGDPKKEEVKPVLGYQMSENFYHNYQHQPSFHPGYAQPCPGYPNPNAQPPPHYYNYQTNYQNYPAGPLPYVSPDVSRGFSFARVMLCLMIFLILFASLMSLITWSMFASFWPTFKVEAFNVRSFEICNGSTLKANWETKVSVKNTNHRSSIMIEHAESTLVYKYVALDTSTIDHMEIGKETTVLLLDAFAFPNAKRSFTGESVVSEMAKDQGRGHMSFDLKIDVEVTFRSGLLKKRNKLHVFCERLILDFERGSTIPTWNRSGSKTECQYG